MITRDKWSASPGSSSSRTPTPSSTRSTPSIRKKRRPRCPECGSKKLLKRDGQIFCDEGHIQQGIRDETQEDEGMTGTRSRYIKKERRKSKVLHGRRDRTKQNEYYGPRRRFLHFQCNQLIFRHQIAALRREWPHLPKEFEAFARDVWSTFILNVHDVEATPLLEGREAEIIASKPPALRSKIRLRSRSTLKSTERSNSRFESEVGSQSDLEELSTVDEEEELIEKTLNDSEGEEEEPRSSLSEFEDEIDDGETGVESRSKKRTNREKRSGRVSNAVLLRDSGRFRNMDPFELEYNIAAIYFTLIIVRVPVILGDLLQLFRAQRIPFLFAAQWLPFEMVERFDDFRRKFYFERQDIPSFTRCQPYFRVMNEILWSSEIQLPELNAAPVLWAGVERLGLPPTIYTTAKNLIPAIELKLKIPFLHTPTAKFLPNIARCLNLIALIVVVVKMRYGLDGEKRYEPPPPRNGFPTPTPSGVPDMKLWLDHLEKAEKTYSEEPAFVQDSEVNTIDVISRDSDDQLDALISHMEKLIIPNNYENISGMYDNQKRRQQAVELLYTSTSTDNPREDPSSNSDSNIQLPSPIDSKQSKLESQLPSLYKSPNSLDQNLETLPINRESLFVGEAYQVYDTSDVLGIENINYQKVVRFASKAFGLSPQELIGGIAEIELTLSQLNRSQSYWY